jgi:hypothetical protein
LLTGLAFVAVLVLGWTGWRAVQVRTDLLAANTDVTAVQDQFTRGDVAGAEAALPGLRRRLDRAAEHSGGLAWGLVQDVPVVGGSFHAARRAALAGQLLGDEVLPEAVSALDLIKRGKVVRDGRVDLALLERVQRHVSVAADASARARTLLAPHDHFLPGQVASALERARTRVNQVSGTLRSAQTALLVAPTMLGAEGAKRYYIAVQNNAEARATGGLIGAFALMSADRGALKLTATGTDSDLKVATTPVPSDPAAAESWKASGSTRAWFNANLTPHFPDAARNIAGQWTAQSGQAIDGVLALDPLVMSELLAVTGPVRLPDGFEVTSANVVDFVGHTEYVRYPDVPSRKKLLGTLAADLVKSVIQAKDSVRTLQALARAGSSGHLYLWSSDARAQALLAPTLVGGALPTKDTPYLSVLTQNYGGDKLDFYVRRSVDVVRLANGSVRVDVTLRNVAPPGLPLYMYVRSDKPQPPVPYGQAKIGMTFYGALSSSVEAVTVDGRTPQVGFDTDHGHDTMSLILELSRERPIRVSVVLSEPAGELVYRQQPLVEPDMLTVTVPHRVVGR